MMIPLSLGINALHKNKMRFFATIISTDTKSRKYLENKKALKHYCFKTFYNF